MKTGLISDIHEDFESLVKALGILESRKCDEVICLGDILGYSSKYYDFPSNENAVKCIQAVKSNCSKVILGNHDMCVAKRIPHYNAGFTYPNNWYELNIEQRAKIAKDILWDYLSDEAPNLSETDYAYLNSLNEMEVMAYKDNRILLTHFIYPDISGSTRNFPRSKDDFDNHIEFMSKHDCNTNFFGHGHYEGSLLTNTHKMRLKRYGMYELKENTNCISVPCIVRGKQQNGLAIYDHKNRTLETIKL